METVRKASSGGAAPEEATTVCDEESGMCVPVRPAALPVPAAAAPESDGRAQAPTATGDLANSVPANDAGTQDKDEEVVEEAVEELLLEEVLGNVRDYVGSDDEDEDEEGGAGGLSVGDALPSFGGLTFVKGAPVDGLGDADAAGDRVLVVEFWATWCGPCRRSIPHLSKLQGKYRGKKAVFVGVTREDRDVVLPFVDEMGDKMAYAVALDSGEEAQERVSKPLGVRGIPHAVVVNHHNVIVYSGHPMDGAFERALKAACDALVPGEVAVALNPVHTSVHCAACHVPTIEGVRFKCLVCEDYNLCGACEADGAAAPHPPEHASLKITHHDLARPVGAFAVRVRSVLALRENTVDGTTGATLHSEINCDGCDRSGLVGVRYRCAVCPNYDLCAACEATSANGKHARDHPLIKMRLRTRANGVHALWRDADAGVDPATLLDEACRTVADQIVDGEVEKDTEDESKPIFRFTAGGDDDVPRFKVRLLVNPGNELYVYAHYMRAVPKERLPWAAEVASMVNYMLKIGAMEMDHRDGEVIFKAVLPHYHEGDGVPAYMGRPLARVLGLVLASAKKIFAGLEKGLQQQLSARDTYYAIFPDERKVEVGRDVLMAALQGIMTGQQQRVALLLMQVLSESGGL
jgi:thiol-disulfide isomerase/thioredoxin